MRLPTSVPGHRAAASLIVSLATASVAGADCPPSVQARIDFIEARLDERRGYARNWSRLWTAAYATGVVFQSVRAGLEDDEGKRADLVVGAVKATYGTARVWRDPPTARLGADPMRDVPANDASGCEHRLAIGEELLRMNAKEARQRWSWKRHLANIAINTVGGLIVTEGFDENGGWMSAGIGIAVGELQIWSRPASGDDDLAEYERRFSPPTTAQPTWSVSAWMSSGAGMRLQVRF